MKGHAWAFQGSPTVHGPQAESDFLRRWWRGDRVRLDSNWQWPFPDSTQRLTVDDTRSGNLVRIRVVRMGGSASLPPMPRA
jgi:hypothetical protein